MLIPVQKKFTKSRIKTYSGTSLNKPFVMPRGLSFRALWIFFGVFVLLYGTFLLLKYTFFVPEYTITKIDYSLANVQKYDDPYLYKMVSTLIRGENYRVAQWNSSSILRQLQTKYPFVTDFRMTYKGANKVFVKLAFDEPQLVVFQGNNRYAVYPNGFFQLFSGNNLGGAALRVELFPASGNALTGLFYLESFDRFIEDLHTVYTAFPSIKYCIYLVGGQRLQLGLAKDRVVYINLLISLPLQIQNYEYLKQYYADFPKLKEIDLGSIEMDKVIVRK